MTNDEIRIKIAEACGWEVIGYTLCNVKPDKNGDPEIEPIAPLPDYLNDLNAMHEAEKAKFNENYWLKWEGVVARMSLPRGTLPLTIWIARMTAPQRAEAFLRTLNLWES